MEIWDIATNYIREYPEIKIDNNKILKNHTNYLGIISPFCEDFLICRKMMPRINGERRFSNFNWEENNADYPEKPKAHWGNFQNILKNNPVNERRGWFVVDAT